MGDSNSDEVVDGQLKSMIVENDHLKQVIEHLRHLVKDYSTGVKETELRLTREFNKKEKQYEATIKQLEDEKSQHILKIYKMTRKATSEKKVEEEITSNQTNLYNKEIQSLKQKLSAKDLTIQQLNKRLEDHHKIFQKYEEDLKSKERRISALNQRLSELPMYRFSRAMPSAMHLGNHTGFPSQPSSRSGDSGESGSTNGTGSTRNTTNTSTRSNSTNTSKRSLSKPKHIKKTQSAEPTASDDDIGVMPIITKVKSTPTPFLRTPIGAPATPDPVVDRVSSINSTNSTMSNSNGVIVKKLKIPYIMPFESNPSPTIPGKSNNDTPIV